MNAAAPAPEDRDDELEARRDGRLHARAPFVTDAELAYLEQLDDVERSTTLAEGVRRAEHLDDEGWCWRVWDSYMRASVDRGHARAGEAAGNWGVEREAREEDERVPTDKMNGKRFSEETKAAYAALSATLGRGPTGKELAAALDISPTAAQQRLVALRKAGELPRVGRRGRNTAASAPRPRASRASSPTSTPRAPAPPRASTTTAPAGLEGVVADLHARRAELVVAIDRIDRALAAALG